MEIFPANSLKVFFQDLQVMKRQLNHNANQFCMSIQQNVLCLWFRLRCQIEGGHVHCAFNSCSYQQRHLGANELAFQNEKGKTSRERRGELRKAVER